MEVVPLLDGLSAAAFFQNIGYYTRRYKKRIEALGLYKISQFLSRVIDFCQINTPPQNFGEEYVWPNTANAFY
jgi:hypothetical protein